MKKYAVIVVLISILAVILAIGSAGTAFAYVSETDYILDKFETVGNSLYQNKTEGCTYRVLINSEAYESLSKITYEKVRLSSLADKVTVDASNNITLHSGQILLESKVTVEKSEFKRKENTENYYFTVSAKENCAFVFTSYYFNSENEEVAVYGDNYGTDGSQRSNVLYCRTIDSSNPIAYAEFNCFDSGKWVFDVTVKGNRNSDVASADSGIKHYKFLYSEKSDINDPNAVVIAEVTNVGRTQDLYRLSVPEKKGAYFIDIIDNVGNETVVKLQEFSGASDPDIYTAVTNMTNRLKDEYYSDFSPKLSEKLQKAYDSYYLILQNSESSESAKSSARQECYDVLREINGYMELKKQGKADVVIRNYNQEFFNGEIDIVNSSALPIKYGDRTVLRIMVSNPDFSTADSVALSTAGVKKVGEFYVVTLETAGVEEETVECKEKLKLKIPREFSREDTYFVFRASVNDKDVYENCDFSVGIGYTEVSVSYASGTLFIFDGAKKQDLTWLWSLVALPVLAVAVVAVVVVKKKGKVTKRHSK